LLATFPLLPIPVEFDKYQNARLGPELEIECEDDIDGIDGIDEMDDIEDTER
jgi:hypothetical protein